MSGHIMVFFPRDKESLGKQHPSLSLPISPIESMMRIVRERERVKIIGKNKRWQNIFPYFRKRSTLFLPSSLLFFYRYIPRCSTFAILFHFFFQHSAPLPTPTNVNLFFFVFTLSKHNVIYPLAPVQLSQSKNDEYCRRWRKCLRQVKFRQIIFHFIHSSKEITYHSPCRWRYSVVSKSILSLFLPSLISNYPLTNSQTRG